MIDITGLREDKRPQSSTIVHALLDRLEAAEKERDATMRLADSLALALNTSNHERDNLRAKIAEMGKQEPVAFGLYSGWAIKAAYLKEHEACEQRDRRQLTADLSGSLEAYRVVPLYALPGAQPAPSVPDFANTKDAARYRWLRENGLANEKRESRAVLPRSGKKASMAFRYWTTPEELDMTIDAMISAAPEAKP